MKNRIIKALISLLSLPVLLLSSCTDQNKGHTYEKTITMYIDSKIEEYDDTTVRYSSKPLCTAQIDGSFSLSVSLAVFNTTEDPKDYNIYDVNMFNYTKNTSHEAKTNDSSFRLGNGFEWPLTFTSTIPSNIEKDEYHLSFGLNKAMYILILTMMPEELKRDVTVSYKINNEVVHTKTVKEGNKLDETYVYDTPNHLQYCSTWKTSNNAQITSNYVVNDDIELTGTLSNNLNIWYMSTDAVACFNRIDHVPLDGKLVLPEYCDGKRYFIGTYTIYNNSNIKEVYLPKTIFEIYRYNFVNCGIKTIYFAGSETEWNAIPKAVSIPSTINIVYNTSFQG